MAQSTVGWHLNEFEYNQSRKAVKARLTVLCGRWKGWRTILPAKREEIINDIESGFWKRSIELYKKLVDSYVIWDSKFNTYYEATCTKIMLNLIPDETTGDVIILSKIASGQLLAAEIAFKTESELVPEASAEIRNEWEKRQRAKIKKNYVEGKKCPKCKATDKIDFNQAQKARADDGYLSTGFVCENCGHTWGG